MAECGTPYLDCVNKPESPESIFKRLISVDAEGNLSLNICGCECGGGDPAVLMYDVTYAELVAAIGGSTLAEGAMYRITDFATVHYMLDGVEQWVDGDGDPEINTCATEPLIVIALNSNTIHSRAYSESYRQDIIYYDWNPSNWLYDIGFSDGAGVIIPGFKGVINFRHDTLNDVSMGYDFRKVLFRRWKTDYTPLYVYSNSEYMTESSTGFQVVDVDDYIDCLTFNGIESYYNTGVRSTHFKAERIDNNQDYFWMPTILMNNVFHLEDYGGYQIVSGNQFGAHCGCNTFGGTVFGNQVGNYFCGNICGLYFKYNVFGNDTITNIFLKDFSFNNVGTQFYNNESHEFVWENTFESSVYDCIFGSYTKWNTFGTHMRYVKIPDKTNGNEFRGNHIMPHVQGTFASKIDFTGGTHVFLNYNCEIYKRLDGAIRLKYMDNSDVAVIVNYNS